VEEEDPISKYWQVSGWWVFRLGGALGEKAWSGRGGQVGWPAVLSVGQAGWGWGSRSNMDGECCSAASSSPNRSLKLWSVVAGGQSSRM